MGSHTPIRDTRKTHIYRHTQTQPHFTAPWHKMGFLCLSRGGPMATEGHMKRWALYNHWCQIGCQLQHKWLSITSAPHVKRPLYRWLDFRQHRKKASSLQPTPLPCRRDCTQRLAFMHTCTRQTHTTFTHMVVNIHGHAVEGERLETHTHLHCNPHTTPSSNTSQMKPWASSKRSHTNTATRRGFLVLG